MTSTLTESHRASPNQPAIDPDKLEHQRMSVRMLTRSELAKQAGLSHSTISHLERHPPLRRASVVTLRKLCKALKCKPEDLLAAEPDAG